jgi:hypothetical protein
MVLFAVLFVAIAVVPLGLYTAEVETTVTGVADARSVDRLSGPERSLTLEPAFTLQFANDTDVGRVESFTGDRLVIDTTVVDRRADTATIECDPGSRCLIVTYDGDGQRLDQFFVELRYTHPLVPETFR